MTDRKRSILGLPKIAIAAVGFVVLILFTQLAGTPSSVVASHTNIKFPFAAGTAWSILQGYNTNPAQGGSHYNCDPNTLKDTVSQSVSCTAPWQYRYSIDLYEASGRTAGMDVLSPVSGTVRWMQASTGGISINLGDGYAVALFHVIVDPGISAGSVLQQGQIIGTVAPPNVAGVGSTPHIHMTLWETTDGGNWSRIARPFTGETTVDGVSLPDLGSGTFNQHRGKSVYSTNQPLSIGSGPAAPMLSSPGSGATITQASSGVVFAWSAVSGATEYQVVLNNVTYSPWVSGTSWKSGALANGPYTWKVRARSSSATGVWSGSRAFTVNEAGNPSGQLTLSLSLTRGKVGEVVTVTGSGFNSGEQVELRWDSASATPIKTITANGSGGFSTQISIPDATRGTHPVHAKAKTTAKTAMTSYEVIPSLTRVPVAGAPGTNVTVTVKGFAANEQVKVSWKSATGPLLGTVTTNGNGSGTLTIAIPNGAPGWTDYTGVGQISGAQAFGAINVLSKVYIYPGSGGVGSTIHADAGGYPPNAPFSVKFNTVNGTGGTTICSGTVSADGIIRCTFTIPQVGAGAYPITIAAGSVSLTDELIVTGPPAVTLSPASAAIGTNVTIIAGGFAPGETVVFSWDSGGSWQSAKADSYGSITVLTTVPNVGAGNHTIRALGSSSGKSATSPYSVSSTAEPGATSMISPGVYSVFATREGLVGGTTSSGHVIVENDYFVALPACTPSNCSGGFTPGNMTQCGNKCYVKVINPVTNVCRVEPILDTGPWFTVDDWWNPTDTRYLNNLSSNPNTLAQGYTGADAARNGLDVGYGIGPNGYGYDNTGTTPGRPWREVGNRAAIDLADGTWYALDAQGNSVGATITVAMMWQTGQDPATEAAACGHPLNQRPGDPISFPPGTSNPSFAGAKLPIQSSSDSPNTGQSARVYDGNMASNWTSPRTTPTSASFTLDLGADKAITGVKWSFAFTGYADSFTVSVRTSGGSTQQLGRFGNGTASQWWGTAAGSGTRGRYVTFTFDNPNRDSVLGSVGEVEVWGEVTVPPGTVNPSFGGAKIPIVNSSDSPSTGTSGRTWDGNTRSNWTSPNTAPSTASFTLDLGSDQQVSGVKWIFAFTGYADRFTVTLKSSGDTQTPLGTFGNGSSTGQWYGKATGSPVRARYVVFTFSNPNRDSVLGSIGEVEVWGQVVNPPGTQNPNFAGGMVAIANSASTPDTGTSSFAWDANTGTDWHSGHIYPSSATLRFDLGSTRDISGVKWKFAYAGYADEFTVRLISEGGSIREYGPFGSGVAAQTFFGFPVSETVNARYVHFVFSNPNGDSAVGSLAEVEIWQKGTIYGPGIKNPSFAGSKVAINNSASTPGNVPSANAWDANTSTNWHSGHVYPSSASLRFDLGTNTDISGVKWKIDYTGFADQFMVRLVSAGGTVREYGPFGNATAAQTFFGFSVPDTFYARYVQFVFSNPNGDSAVGSLSEVEIWQKGTSYGPGTQNPGFSGSKLTIVNSADTPVTGTTTRAWDNNINTNWFIGHTYPSSAQLRFDLGSNRDISGVKWRFAYPGYTDEFTVRLVSAGGSVRIYGPFGSGTSAQTFFGFIATDGFDARYVQFIFSNPNNKSAIGSISEVEIWGSSSVTFSAAVEAEASPVAAGTPIAGASPVPDVTPGAEGSLGLEASPIAEETPGAEASPIAEGTPNPVPAVEEASPAPVPTISVEPPDEVTPAPEVTPEPDASPSVKPIEEPVLTVEPTSADVATPGSEVPDGSPVAESSFAETSTPELTEPTGEPAESPTLEPTQAVVSEGYVANTGGDGAFCRVGPGTDFESWSLLPEGTALQLIGNPIDGWQEVICGEQTGYVFAEFISLDVPVEPSPTEIETVEATATEAVDQEPTSTEPVTEPEVEDPIETATSVPTATIEPTLEPTPTQEPELVQREIVIPVASDTSVSGLDPEAVQSGNDIYSLAAGGPDEDLAVMTFDVSGIGDATVIDARLIVTGAGASGGQGGQVLAGPGLWFDESSTTWNTVANAAPWQFGWIDWIEPGVESSVDVTQVIGSDGVVSFVIVGTPEQPMAISSRENGSPAYLVITIEEYVYP